MLLEKVVKMPKVEPNFVKRNLVAIVMIPTLIGIHYGWNVMQNNRTLVSESERIDLPAITLVKFCWRKLTQQNNETERKAIEK